MKRYYKIILPILLILVMIFGSCASAYANVGTGIIAFFNLFADIQDGKVSSLIDFIDEAFKNSGLIGPKIPGDLQTLDEFVRENYPELEGEDDTETNENVMDYLATNISVDDNSKTYTFNNNSRSFFLNLASYYENQNKIDLWYTCDVQQSTPRWLNAGFVSDFTTIEENYPNYIYTVNRFDTSNVYLIGVPQSPKIYGVLAYVFDTDWEEFYFYRCTDINGVLSYEPITIRDSSLMVYEVDSQGHCTLLNDNSVVNFGYSDKTLYSYFTKESGQSCGGDSWQQYPKTFSTNAAYIQTFLSVNALDNYIHTIGIGLQPYYYNNEVWSNFSNSTGDYTVSENNINTITYGDVVSYVNDYHDTNNNYPDNSTVNNWIETTNNNNNGSGGGGSGGGGSGSGDDSTGIFDFLSKIGQVLGNLIKNLGSVLTDLIEGIAETISGLFESIPTIFGDFLGALLGWLPDELQALIILGISAMIIVGLIKVFRG